MKETPYEYTSYYYDLKLVHSGKEMGWGIGIPSKEVKSDTDAIKWVQAHMSDFPNHRILNLRAHRTIVYELPL